MHDSHYFGAEFVSRPSWASHMDRVAVLQTMKFAEAKELTPPERNVAAGALLTAGITSRRLIGFAIHPANRLENLTIHDMLAICRSAGSGYNMTDRKHKFSERVR
jgi:hypothetical protein